MNAVILLIFMEYILTAKPEKCCLSIDVNGITSKPEEYSA